MNTVIEKPWQHGYHIDTLKALETFYAPHNQYAISVFGKFKKNDIAAHLHKGTLKVSYDERGTITSAYVAEQAKVPNKIVMFGKTVIGEKRRGDITFSRICGDRFILNKALESDGEYGNNNCWLIAFAGNKDIRELAEHLGFEEVGYKVTSFSEILTVYFRNAGMAFSPRRHPTVAQAELVGMAKIADADTSTLLHIYNTLRGVAPVFTNHYSNYNIGGAWSAIALRGYSDNPSFITKPSWPSGVLR